MPKSKRTSGHFKFDLPRQSKRKRPGSKSSYKPPAGARQLMKDKAYIEFQTVPKLNAVTQSLHNHIGQCDVIFGGKQIWLRKKVKQRNGSEKTQSFPIVVDGRRCDSASIFSITTEGKTSRRCERHAFSDYWIKVDPELPQDT